MSEPLGRDRLGRLVYEGDWLIDERNQRIAKAMESFGGGMHAYRVNWTNSAGIYWEAVWHDLFAEVDLAASPKRSNYGRYFADLGTLDEVIELMTDDGVTDEGFPFWADFTVHCIHNTFGDWLQQEATV